MTEQQISESYYPQIVKYFEALLTKSSVYQLQEDCDKETVIETYYDLLPTRFMYWVQKFKEPVKRDADYSRKRMFIHTFHVNCFPYLLKDIARKMETVKEKSLSSCTEDEVKQYEEKQENNLMQENPTNEIKALNENMVDRVEALQKFDNLVNEFPKWLNTVEKKVFNVAAFDTMAWEQLINEIGTLNDGSLMTEAKLRPIRNKIEFRFLCYIFACEFLSEKEFILRANRKFANLNKRYFGVPKISTAPDIELLKQIAYDKLFRAEIYHRSESIAHDIVEIEANLNSRGVWNIERVFGDSECILKSKTDLRRGKHDHYILYVNASGWALDYSDPSKKPVNLFEERMVA